MSLRRTVSQTDEDAEDEDEGTNDDESARSQGATTPAGRITEVRSASAKKRRAGGSAGSSAEEQSSRPAAGQRPPGRSPTPAQQSAQRSATRGGLRSVPEGLELPASPARPSLVASPAHSGRSLSRTAFESWAAEELDAGVGGEGIGGLDFSLDAMGLGADDDAVWRRTRAHISLADISLEELEARLQRGDEDRAAAEDAEYHQFLEARPGGRNPRVLVSWMIVCRGKASSNRRD